MKEAFRTLASAAALAMTLASAPAGAAPFWLSYDTVYTGDTPASATPWLTASFDDTHPTGVLLTLKASLESPSEFITNVRFNLDPALDKTKLSFTASNAVGASLPTVTVGNITGQGLTFDFEFSFQTAAGPGRFDGTDAFETLILFNNGAQFLSAEDFKVLSEAEGTNVPQYSLAHVQGIPTGGSGWVAGTVGDGPSPPAEIPEPGTIFLLGSALAALGLRRRFRI